jgi:hypothetical protein
MRESGERLRPFAGGICCTQLPTAGTARAGICRGVRYRQLNKGARVQRGMMTQRAAPGRAIGAGVLAAAAAVSLAACGIGITTGTAVSESSEGGNSLILAGKTVDLSQVLCRVLGDNAFIVGKSATGDQIVTVRGDKVESASFHVEGVAYFWETTSTGGQELTLTKADNRYTVTGKIKELKNYRKLSDFTFAASCAE